MAATQPLRSIAWTVGGEARYTLNSRGKLQVEYIVGSHPEAKVNPTFARVQDIEGQTLALKILYQELAKYLPAVEESGLCGG